MKKIFLLFIIFSFSYQASDAQGRKVYEQAATDALNVGDYSAALGYYEILLEDAGYEDLQGYYNAAEAAYNFKLFNRAERYFQWAIDNGGRENYATIDYQMAMTKKRLGKYAEAKALFEKYKNANASTNTALVAKATKEIADCDWAIDLVDNPVVNIHAPLPVTNPEMIEHLDSTVNTAYTDLAPLFRNQKLYYSSVRYFAGEDKAPIARILSTENGEIAAPVSGWGSGENSVAHTAFSKDGNRVYFTICDTVGINKYRCDLYFRDAEGQGWGKAQKLPDNINKKNTTSTHPAIGVDNTTGEEILFFVSDRSGGKGGLDIWCSLISDGKVGAAYNVAAVNTANDDITPYFHNKKNTLFFSSDGRQSLGGFDIYKSKKEGKEWTEAAHTGYPLNSGYDDVYPSLNPKGDKVYFSSNRPGGICKDETALECVCDDIYAADAPFIDLIVETYNKLDPTMELTQTVVNLTTSGVKSVSRPQGPNDKYTFLYDLDFNNAYNIEGTKTGYTSDGTEFDTYELTESGTIIKKLYLTPHVSVEAETYDKVTGEPLTGVTVNLMKATPITMDSTKTNFNGNDFGYGLSFKQRYLLIATKPGYLPDTVEVFTDNIPLVPTILERELRLCKKPFDTNPEIVLYFDNDIPKKRKGSAVQTNSNYKDTYNRYVADSKRQEYLRAFRAEEEKDRVRQFFQEVTNNFTKLENFAGNLHAYLSATNDPTEKVVITIKGYASPLAKPAYNKLLTERRIYSVEKYLREYQGGILAPYMSQVSVQREPYGEEVAQGGSEDRKNKKASIYSIDASQERRVEIINIEGVKQTCDPK